MTPKIKGFVCFWSVSYFYRKRSGNEKHRGFHESIITELKNVCSYHKFFVFVFPITNQEKASFFFHIAWINTKNQILCLKIEKKKRRRKSTQTNAFDWMVEKFENWGRKWKWWKRQNKLNLGSFFQAWFCSNGKGLRFPVQLPLERPSPATVIVNTRAMCSREKHLETMVHPQIFTTRCTSGKHAVPILVHQVKVLHLYFSIFFSLFH